jgi:hypothetical protein
MLPVRGGFAKSDCAKSICAKSTGGSFLPVLSAAFTTANWLTPR